jgi:hypothetical protein
MGKEPRLLDQVRAAIRTRNYSISTEQAYVDWIRRYILFHQMRPPLDTGKTEIEAFLTHLAVNRNVAASTQNQAHRLKDLLHMPQLHRAVLPKELSTPRICAYQSKRLDLHLRNPK